MLLAAWLQSAFLYLFITLFIIVSVFLILIVLIQKGRGGGLASAFGGGGGNTAFGSKTGDVLTWVTSVMLGIFLVLAVGLNLLAENRQNSYKPRGAVAPAAPVAQQEPVNQSPSSQDLSTDPRPVTKQTEPVQAPGSGSETGTAKPADQTTPAAPAK